MISKVIRGFTHIFGAPKTWDPAQDGGECRPLHVRRVLFPNERNHSHESAWEPTPDELAMLNDGGSVVVSIVGGQPPINVFVEKRDTSDG